MPNRSQRMRRLTDMMDPGRCPNATNCARNAQGIMMTIENSSMKRLIGLLVSRSISIMSSGSVVVTPCATMANPTNIPMIDTRIRNEITNTKKATNGLHHLLRDPRNMAGYRTGSAGCTRAWCDPGTVSGSVASGTSSISGLPPGTSRHPDRAAHQMIRPAGQVSGS